MLSRFTVYINIAVSEWQFSICCRRWRLSDLTCASLIGCDVVPTSPRGLTTFYLKMEKPSNSSRSNFGKVTKKELVMTLTNIELLSSCVSFSFTWRHFPAFLICYKMGEHSKSKFALNSIFTFLALPRFFLNTVALLSGSLSMIPMPIKDESISQWVNHIFAIPIQ